MEVVESWKSMAVAALLRQVVAREAVAGEAAAQAMEQAHYALYQKLLVDGIVEGEGERVNSMVEVEVEEQIHFVAA